MNTELALMGAWEVWEAPPPSGRRGRVMGRTLMVGEGPPIPPSLPYCIERLAWGRS